MVSRPNCEGESGVGQTAVSSESRPYERNNLREQANPDVASAYALRATADKSLVRALLRRLESRLLCERYPKGPEAFDSGKPLGGLARRQCQNRGRDFAADETVDRPSLSFAELDFCGPRRPGVAQCNARGARYQPLEIFNSHITAPHNCASWPPFRWSNQQDAIIGESNPNSFTPNNLPDRCTNQRPQN
ncbi:hypothetical protein V1278_004336 [Bradyrhizobium sp. AZCC 1577]